MHRVSQGARGLWTVGPFGALSFSQSAVNMPGRPRACPSSLWFRPISPLVAARLWFPASAAAFAGEAHVG